MGGLRAGSPLLNGYVEMDDGRRLPGKEWFDRSNDAAVGLPLVSITDSAVGLPLNDLVSITDSEDRDIRHEEFSGEVDGDHDGVLRQ